MTYLPIPQLIPALPFLRLVGMFARARGMRFFTLLEQLTAADEYLKMAVREN